ncbi:hypothetical protein H2200_005889 [Cladophialophora chaetospira]|uniref:Heterokaryon incompatibility domain-containing protein n=1 Tax=Cladophialophora chaetospira TaxID=386627 RepID=A0AA38X9X0_9EURO|nr:hypothetical protein H2200_005889 [Cladophialophora chaetospira]
MKAAPSTTQSRPSHTPGWFWTRGSPDRDYDQSLRGSQSTPVFGEITVWWIDQICINQEDEADKTQQMKLMKKIFERAHMVMAWLGPASENSDFAMEMIEQNSPRPAKSTSNKSARAHASLGFDPEVEARLSKAIGSLGRRQWWQRTWILPEATAIKSSKTWIICGTKRVSLKTMLSFRKRYHYLPPVIKKAASRFPQTGSVFKLVQHVWVFHWLRTRSRGFKLYRLLDHVAATETTDPRDKIFSMLAFSKEHCKSGSKLQPDYSISPFDAYVQCALWHISRYKNLHVLGFCTGIRTALNNTTAVATRPTAMVGVATADISRQNATGQEQRLPSWTPSWVTKSHRPDTSPLLSRMRDTSISHHDKYIFNACGPFRSVKCNFDDKPNKSVTHLSVLGIKLVDIGVVHKEGDLPLYEKGALCSVTGLAMQEVVHRTIRADVQKCFKRKMKIYYRRLGGDSQHTNRKNSESSQEMSHSNCLFETNPSQEDDTGIIGLATKRAQTGDQVWLLQGCRVLVVLRPHVVAMAHEHGSMDLETGLGETKALEAGQTVYEYVGESFILGLMDGEVVDMLGPQPGRATPPSLSDMDREFQKIGLL